MVEVKMIRPHPELIFQRWWFFVLIWNSTFLIFTLVVFRFLWDSASNLSWNGCHSLHAILLAQRFAISVFQGHRPALRDLRASKHFGTVTFCHWTDGIASILNVMPPPALQQRIAQLHIHSMSSPFSYLPWWLMRDLRLRTPGTTGEDPVLWSIVNFVPTFGELNNLYRIVS